MPKNKTRPPKRKQFVMPQAGASLDLKTAVIRALEDERYDWRTLDGLATALGTSEREVLGVLNSIPDQIVRAASADGQSLFTTRSHYEKTHGFGDKILSALADKVVA
jgi:hypothetical protein